MGGTLIGTLKGGGRYLFLAAIRHIVESGISGWNFQHLVSDHDLSPLTRLMIVISARMVIDVIRAPIDPVGWLNWLSGMGGR